DEPGGFRESRGDESRAADRGLHRSVRRVLSISRWCRRGRETRDHGCDPAWRIGERCRSNRRRGQARLSDGVYRRPALPALTPSINPKHAELIVDAHHTFHFLRQACGLLLRLLTTDGALQSHRPFDDSDIEPRALHIAVICERAADVVIDAI